MKFLRKLGEWIRRYGVAEIMSIVAAIVGARVTWAWSHNEAAAAYGGSLAEATAFWCTMIVREIRSDTQFYASRGIPYGKLGILRTLRNLLLECGPAELFDSGFIRPLAMGIFAHYMNRDLGVLLGKLVGDVFFYVPAIMSYEARQWMRSKTLAVK